MPGPAEIACSCFFLHFSGEEPLSFLVDFVWHMLHSNNSWPEGRSLEIFGDFVHCQYSLLEKILLA
jgi:hypothetical protein